MVVIKGRWTRLSTDEQLQRSSQSIAVSNGVAYLFGGELEARKPRDNDIYQLYVKSAETQLKQASSTKPTPRVGATLTAVDGKLYVFSGRGGEAMTPLDEGGALQVFDISSSSWSALRPKDTASPVPESRSYHCAATDGHSRIFIHAGCPEKGRLRDLWSFDINEAKWRKHADAPGPPRGGTSIAFADGKIWRMNGFDGKSELGGSLDVFDPNEDQWSTIEYAADGKEGPGSRSVSALVSTNILGEPHLVTLFGEADPSSLGHAGAGKMLSDAWAFSLSKRAWKKIEPVHDDVPLPRGWFDAAAVDINGQIVVSGGLADTNERIADAWLLEVY